MNESGLLIKQPRLLAFITGSILVDVMVCFRQSPFGVETHEVRAIVGRGEHIAQAVQSVGGERRGGLL